MRFYSAGEQRIENGKKRRLKKDGTPDKRYPAPSEYVGERFPINSAFRVTDDMREQLRELGYYLRMSRNEILRDAVERYYYNDIDTKTAKSRSADDGRYPIKTTFRISTRTKDQMRALSYHPKKSRNEIVKEALGHYYKDKINTGD